MDSKDFVLVGKILKVHRYKNSSKADISVSVEDMLRGKLRSNYLKQLEVKFNLPEDKINAYKSIFRKNSLCFLSGSLKKLSSKNVFVCDDCICTNKVAIEQIKKNLNDDPNLMRAQVVEAGGFSLASRTDLVASDELTRAEIISMQEWLSNHHLAYDLDTAWGIHTYFQNRAAARSKGDQKLNVLGLIKKNPLMLADYSPSELSVSRLKNVYENCKDISVTAEMEIMARLSEELFRAAKRGHSCLPMKRLSFLSQKIRGLLNELGIPENERAHYLTQLCCKNLEVRAADIIIDRQGIEPVLPDVKQYFRTLTKDAENLSKEELKSYNRGKIVPTWMIDSLSTFVYLPKLYYAEKYLARAILDQIHAEIEPMEVKDNYFVNLNDGQKAAIEKALNYPLSVILGGAGTGKTYIIRRLSLIAFQLGKKTIILAPTATAAANAGRGSSQADYFTIHRYSKISPTDDDLGTSYETKTSPEDISDASIIVIDEMSMCTLPVFARMIKSVEGKNVRIVLVGDDKQLPAVGSNVFKAFADGLFGEDIPITRLTDNLRSEKTLAEFTTKIRKGIFDVPVDTKEIRVIDKTPRWFFTHEFVDFDNTLILTSTRNDQIKLNDLLRGVEGRATDRIQVRDEVKNIDIETDFYVGDPVVCSRNDYFDVDEESDSTELFATREFHHPDRKINVYNGTFGKIEAVSTENDTAYIRLYPPEVSEEGILLPYRIEELPLLFEVAYAVTTHKAQGGEKDTVIFVADSEDASIRRSMLYTAATRAKKQIVFIGDIDFFKKSAAKEDEDFLSLLPFRFLKEMKYPTLNKPAVIQPESDALVQKTSWRPSANRFKKTF